MSRIHFHANQLRTGILLSRPRILLIGNYANASGDLLQEGDEAAGMLGWLQREGTGAWVWLYLTVGGGAMIGAGLWDAF